MQRSGDVVCGITGFIDPSRTSNAAALSAIVTRMADTLRARGPDGGGAWADADCGVALGHRRLAILDLSPAGSQPMASACGRFLIVLNGEIYNFDLLQDDLSRAGHVFKGRSDTEVLLAAFSQWGLEDTLRRLRGMFAFALWDRRERSLTLARDRLGEKPLYYGLHGGALLFGSQLRPLREHPAWRGEIDRDALALQMRHSCVPAPHCIFKNTRKLPPGTFLTIPLSQTAETLARTPQAYWSAKEAAEAGAARPFSGGDDAAAEALDTLLRDVLARQRVADVPLGAFLSGGIDSSLITALLQTQSSRPVRTFTIGFNETDFNEAMHAKAVATHLGTAHTELFVTDAEALAVVPKLPDLYDEPFSDSSQIPTFLAAQLAKKSVSVCLSGDGGDELFCGYPRYAAAQYLWKKVGGWPRLARRALGCLLSATPASILNKLLALQNPGLSHELHSRSTPARWRMVGAQLSAASAEALYRGLVSHWQRTELLVPGAHEPPTALTDTQQHAALPEFLQRMMWLDTISYLPDDILTKTDRASMGASLETRAPLLDHRVVELAWQLPLNMKFRNGEGKWLLRQVLRRYLPARLTDRPKMGFGAPIGAWLRGSLRGWAEALLEEARLKREGFFNPAPIKKKWREHQSGSADWHADLWDVLMFQAWLERGGT
jgi:asparagine synthase (glutamine-hydrolysing)